MKKSTLKMKREKVADPVRSIHHVQTPKLVNIDRSAEGE